VSAPIIRAVDPAEADHDVGVRYALSIIDQIEAGQGKLVPFKPREFRPPHDRGDVIASIMHESICRSGGCDASGGHSSLSYDSSFDGGVHYAWVAAWPTLRAELATFARVIPGDLDYHVALAIDGGATPLRLGPVQRAQALALVLHRHCADSALMPAGCGDPTTLPCVEARRAGAVIAEWMGHSQVGFWPAARTDLVRREGLLEDARARHRLFWRLDDEGAAAGLPFEESLDRALAAVYGDQEYPPEGTA
jgi:hypothetical protein